MSTGDPLYDQLTMRRGLSGGAHEPLQRLDFNFADAGMGGAFSHPMAPMLLQPLINSMFGHGGMMPAQFSPQQSFYDQQRAKSYWQARNAAMQTASQADRETYVQMIRGIAQMQGTPWGIEQQRSANVMAGDVAYMAPILAQSMPETFDQLHGTRGSATVMASFLHRAGITAVDPTTGRTGVSGDSAGVLAAEMHRRFFGAGANLADWRGLSAGRAGALYDELQTRGMMGMSIGAMTPAERTAALTGSMTSRQDAVRLLQAQDPTKWATLGAGAGGLGGADVTAAIQNMKDTNPTQHDAMLRQFDANQIGNRLKTMAGAVAAMREILGDMGHPNAPMAELIEGLNSLTQGGLATMNPQDLERSVRTTQVIARTSGIGMTALTGLITQGAAAATAMGLDTRFGITAGHSAAEFGSAFGQVGRGDIAAWGRLDKDKLMLKDEQLTLNAAASPMSNRLGAMMRLIETQEAAHIGLSPEMAAIAAAVRSGASEYQVGEGPKQSLNMTEQRWREITAAGKINPMNAMMVLRATAGNQEQIDRYGIADITRKEQRGEINFMLKQGFHEAAVGALQAAGVTDTELASVAAQAQSESLMSMDPKLRAVDATRNQRMMDATRAAVIGRLQSRGMAPAEAAAEFDRLFPAGQLSTMVAAGIGQAQQRIATDPRWKGYESLHAMLDLSSERVQERQQVLRQERAAEVAMGTALGGLGTAGPLARLMDEIQHPSGSFGDAVKRVLGSQDPEEVRRRLARIDPADIEARAGVGAKDRLGVIMEELMKTTAEYEKGRDDKTLTPERSAELQARISGLRSGGTSADAQIKIELVKAGLVSADADDATVRAVAQQVQSGAVAAPEELKNRIGALVASGGAVDSAALLRQQEAKLATMGFKPEEYAAALAGSLDKDARMTGNAMGREELRMLALTRAGLDVVSAESGIFIGAEVGSKQLGDVSNQQALLEEDLATALPAAGPEREKALATRRRHAAAVVDRGGQWTDVLMGNAASMRNLGKGGFELVKGAQEKQQEMARIAAGAGLNVANILASDDDSALSPAQQEVATRIRTLHGQVGEARAQMIRRFDRTDPFEAMTTEEEEAYTKHVADITRPDDEKNKELIGKITKGGDAVTEAEQAKISQALGKGTEGDQRRYELRKRFDARAALEEMAKTTGVGSVEKLRADVRGVSGIARFFGMGALSSDDASKADELLKAAGGLGEGKSTADILTTIDEDNKQRKAAAAEAGSKTAAGAGGGKMGCSGEVTVHLDKGTMDMSGMKVDVGSTPVAS